MEESEVGRKEKSNSFSQLEKNAGRSLEGWVKEREKEGDASFIIDSEVHESCKAGNVSYGRNSDRKWWIMAYSVRHSVREGRPQGKPKG